MSSALPTLEQEPAAPPPLSSSSSDRDDPKVLDEKSVHLEGQHVPEGEMIDHAPLAGVVRAVRFPSVPVAATPVADQVSRDRRPRSRRSTKSLALAGANSASGFCTSRLASAATSSRSTRRRPRSTLSTQPRLSISTHSSEASRLLKVSLALCRFAECPELTSARLWSSRHPLGGRQAVHCPRQRHHQSADRLPAFPCILPPRLHRTSLSSFFSPSHPSNPT